MALSYDINANTRAAIKANKDLGKSFEEVSDELDDLGKGRDLDKVEADLKGLARTADTTGTSIGNDLDDGFDKAGRSAEKFQRDASGNVQEAVQNLSEVASSWEGDVQGMADGVQGLTGGLAAALTPGIGIPVAILGAAAAAFFASWVKSAEDSEARVQAMYEDFIESGTEFASEEFLSQAIKDIASDTGKWAEANKTVEETGVGIGTVLKAMAGDQAAMTEVHAAYVGQRDAELAAIKAAGGSIEEQAVKIDAVNAKFGEEVGWIGTIQRDTQTAAEKAAGYRDAMGGAADETERTANALGRVKDVNATVRISVDDSAWASWQPSAKYGKVYTSKGGEVEWF